jgi:hypothetical protein
MKHLLVVLMLLPSLALAQGRDRVFETDTSTTIELDSNGNKSSVRKERNIYQKEGARETYSNCEKYQWNSPWQLGTKVECNWSERDAIEVGLTSALDGFKIEWYNPTNRTRGEVIVAHTLPQTQQGWCRIILVGRYNGNIIERTPYTMCFNEGRGWRNFSGH